MIPSKHAPMLRGLFALTLAHKRLRRSARHSVGIMKAERGSGGSAMASISSDSKVTTLPSRTAEAAKPAGANSPAAQAAPVSAAPPGGGFDPSSSFFPQSLPGGDAPAAEAGRAPRRRRWIASLAALLLLAAAFLYYYRLPGEVGSAMEPRSTRTPALEGTPALAQGAQPRVTHTLEGAAKSESQAAVPVQSTVPASPAASSAGASLPAPAPASTPAPTAKPAAPRVTHTQPIAPAAAVKAEEPQRPAAAPTDAKAAECSGPASVLNLCDAPRTNERR